MSQKDQLLLPIDNSHAEVDRKTAKSEKPNNVTLLDSFKREKEQETSNKKIKEYLDSYKIFV